MSRQALGNTLVCLVLLTYLSGAGGRAWGEPPPADAPTASSAPPTESPESGFDNAQRHFDRGVVLYNNGDYQTALAEFEAAYLLFPTASTLENIGLTQKALYRYPESVASLLRYLETAKKITPEKTAQIRALIDEMRALLAEVTLTITPEGATVLIDGRNVGQSPIAPITLAAGRHEIELNAPEHESLHRGILVIAGQPLALTLQLKPILRTGQLRIRAVPPTAMIRIEGKLYGTGSVEVELASGGYTLEVSAPGYRTERSEIAIAPGQLRSLTPRLDALPKKLTFRQLRWVLIPAIVLPVGGIITAAVLVSRFSSFPSFPSAPQ